MNSVFELLQKKGYIKRGRIIKGNIQNASLNDIIGSIIEICELTTATNIKQDTEIFAQSASLSMGCSRWPCSELKCRLKRAENLVHYAALYGDRIYIKNFLQDHIEHLTQERMPDVTEVRYKFFEDLQIFIYLRPLIEAGLIIPITPPHLCKSCLAKSSLGHDDDKSLNKAMKEFTNTMVKNINVEFSKKRDLYSVTARGSEHFLDHGFAGFISEIPFISPTEMPRIFRRIENGEEILLSRWAMQKSGFADFLASKHYESIFFELILAQSLGTGFLTDMPVHIRFLKNLALTPTNAERDLAIEKHLSCLVPFAKELKPSEILKLRNQDSDSFIMFKTALAKAVTEYQQNYGVFTESDAKALFNDVIRPQLSELETKIKKSRRLLIKGSYRTMLSYTAVIGLGLYSGLSPEGRVSAATALGLTGIVQLIKDLMNASDVEENIRTQNMYFLWKLQKKTK